MEKIEERDEQFMLANFAFLSQTDNRSIQDKAPSAYKALMPVGALDAILESALIPLGGLDMKYKAYIDARSDLLAAKANSFFA